MNQTVNSKMLLDEAERMEWEEETEPCILSRAIGYGHLETDRNTLLWKVLQVLLADLGILQLQQQADLEKLRGENKQSTWPMGSDWSSLCTYTCRQLKRIQFCSPNHFWIFSRSWSLSVCFPTNSTEAGAGPFGCHKLPMALFGEPGSNTLRY